MEDGKSCLQDLESDLLRQLYVKVCPNATRPGSKAAVDCTLNAGQIQESNQTDLQTGERQLHVTVENGGMLLPQCADGFEPNAAKLSCANGALFPASYECSPKACKAPTSTTVPNAFDGGGCLEGSGDIAHGSWCTPRCESGYRASWSEEAVDPALEPAHGCDWPTRPSATALCCSRGVLLPSRFKCEPYMQLSDTLSTLAVKTVFHLMSEIVPEGLSLVKMEHSKTADVDRLFVVRKARGVSVDFRRFNGYFEMLGNLSAPLPNETRGLGKFAVNISGRLEVDWLNDTIRCYPDKLKCKINTLAYMHSMHRDFANFSATKFEDMGMNMTTKPEKFDWMNSYEDACGFNLCSKIYELSIGFENRHTGFSRKPSVDMASKMVEYNCTGTDPSFILFLPTLIMTFVTALFYCFSSQLLLQPWKDSWKVRRRIERLNDTKKAADASAASSAETPTSPDMPSPQPPAPSPASPSAPRPETPPSYS